MKINGEAFIPGNCPALRQGDDLFTDPNRGYVVQPSDIEIDVENTDANLMDVDKIDPTRAKSHLYAYIALDPRNDIHAKIVNEAYEADDPNIVLPDLIDDDPDAEQNVGGLVVCDRIKKCMGRVELGGEVVCQALHPEEVMADLRRHYFVD